MTLLFLLFLVLPADIPKVALVVQQSPAAVSEAVMHLNYPHFTIVKNDSVMFPEQYNLEFAAKSDPLIRKYLEIPPALRKNDLYLRNTSGEFWSSEINGEDKPVSFRCNFIVHLEPRDGQTEIAIFEYLPEIALGKKFHMLGHHGPGYYDDVKLVPSTTVDRLKLLAAVKRSLQKK